MTSFAESNRDALQSAVQTPSPSLPNKARAPTGIAGLDSVLGGGLPCGRSVLVAGRPGSGKTVLLNEFLYRGITRFDEPGVFVTFEERPEEIIADVSGFGWDYHRLIDEGRLAIVDMTPFDGESRTGGQLDLSPIRQRIVNAVARLKARRVSIDTMASLLQRYSDQPVVRQAMLEILDDLKRLECIPMMSAELAHDGGMETRYGVEEYLTDGAIFLSTQIGENQVRRQLSVTKLRGAGYRSGAVEYQIDENGFTCFAKVLVDMSVAVTDYAVRKSFDVPGLDRMLDGGIPQGHIALLGGNTGTGKTILAMHFLEAGMRRREPALWVGLEEPVPQVTKTALSLGWDLRRRERDGELVFITAPLLDLSVDSMLHSIATAIDANGIQRLVIDSVSSMESAVLNKEKVREMLIQLNGICKSRGATCLLTYLSAASFGAGPEQLLSDQTTNEMRLSSVVDAIVLLRFVERAQSVKKLMMVLKLRGSGHAKDIFSYDIGPTGIVVGERFDS